MNNLAEDTAELQLATEDGTPIEQLLHAELVQLVKVLFCNLTLTQQELAAAEASASAGLRRVRLRELAHHV